MNGCTTYQDITTGPSVDRMIMVDSGKFDVPCMTILAGQMVDFMWNFAMYPLAPGLAPEHMGDTAGTTPSPIMSTTTGMDVKFTFPSAGLYPFYVPGFPGMDGTIQVK
jgi:hypothetical protein